MIEQNLSAEIAKFQQYLLCERGFKPHGVACYSVYIRRFKCHLLDLGLGSFADADSTAIRGFLYKQSQSVSVWTMRVAFAALRALYRMLRTLGPMMTDPTDGISAPRPPRMLPRYLELEEIERMLSEIPSNNPVNLRDRVLLEFLFGTGLRISEVVGITLADISADSVKVMGKGSKERVVPLMSGISDLLALYLESSRPLLHVAGGGRQDQNLFLSYRGKRLATGSAWFIVRRRARDAGINKRVYPHLFRHSFATHLIRNGADVRALQDLLGHASLNSTMAYTHLNIAAKKKALRYHPRSLYSTTQSPPKTREELIPQPPATATTGLELVYAESA